MNSKPVSVVAIITAQPGKEAAVRQALTALIPITRKERGCINYDMHVTRDNPAQFVFYENWSSQADLDAHIDSAHVKALMAKAHELMVGGSPELIFAEKIV